MKNKHFQPELKIPKKPIAFIPAYNESKTIVDVINRHKKDYAIIVVDDGSTDGTGELALKEEVLVVRSNKNLGKGEAIRFGRDKIKELLS